MCKNSKYKLIFIVSFFAATTSALAQQSVQLPDRRFVFEEDTKEALAAKNSQVKQILITDEPANKDLSFKAAETQYDKERSMMKGTGGVIISQSGMQAQSNEADLNMTTKDGILTGNVEISTSEASISAEQSNFNFENEVGDFTNSQVNLEQGSFVVDSEKMEKVSETEFNFFDTAFTSCHCNDEDGKKGNSPWKITASEANVTQNGYAHCYNAVLDFHGVPLLYTPYIGFPVKQERESGLMVPQFGYGNQDGMQFTQPIFGVIDDHTDVTVSPFIETKTRVGSFLDFRKIYSRYNRVEGRLLYSDESLRDGDLRGTVTSDVFDPELDADGKLTIQDRVGVKYFQSWRAAPEDAIPFSFISDIRYIGDDLLLREIENSQIDVYNTPYVTSKMVLRAPINDVLTAEVGAEYNQFISTDDDLAFQRLPEFRLSGVKTNKIFGTNPYGAKLVSKGAATVTDFVRQEGYDGIRTDVAPNFSVPFHYKNYFASSLGFGAKQTYYNLRDQNVPGSTVELDSSSERTIFNISYGTSTAIERVYDLEKDSFITKLASLGSQNQQFKLQRVKHTVEPFLRYNFIPPTGQGNVPESNSNDLPFFDSSDRIRQKSLFTYGFKTSLYGRYLPYAGSSQQITELTPKIEELPDINSILPQSTEFGGLDDYRGLGGGGAVSSRVGEIRELVGLTVKQAYNYTEETKDIDPNVGPLSDMNTEFSFFPSKTFAFSFLSNYDTENQDFSSWGLGTHFRDDRGDSLKARYSYTENTLSQLEGNVELAVTQRIKAGYYSRFDELQSEIIEQRVGLRLYSACNCWFFDIGYMTRINPDRENFMINFSLAGLGNLN